VIERHHHDVKSSAPIYDAYYNRMMGAFGGTGFFVAERDRVDKS
jgi:hypothetical protein